MALHRILIPVRGDGLGEGVLDHALTLARRFNAHLDVVHCRARPEDMLPFGVFVTSPVRNAITASAASFADAEEARLRGFFDDYCRQHDLLLVDNRPRPRDRVTISWREIMGKQADIVAGLGRVVDLIAVARPDRDRNLGSNTLESALMETGKAVLMCPPSPPTELGRHVALAWNDSAEAARAVTAALPLLGGAEKVTVLTVDIGKGEPQSEALCGLLGDHGISAEAHAAIPAKSNTVGQALLRAAKEQGADSLLMGAYGQSRRRELVLGGVTQHVIDHAELPVFLAH